MLPVALTARTPPRDFVLPRLSRFFPAPACAPASPAAAVQRANWQNNSSLPPPPTCLLGAFDAILPFCGRHACYAFHACRATTRRRSAGGMDAPGGMAEVGKMRCKTRRGNVGLLPWHARARARLAVTTPSSYLLSDLTWATWTIMLYNADGTLLQS